MSLVFMFAKANSSTPNTFNSEDLSIHVLKRFQWALLSILLNSWMMDQKWKMSKWKRFRNFQSFLKRFSIDCRRTKTKVKYNHDAQQEKRKIYFVSVRSQTRNKQNYWKRGRTRVTKLPLALQFCIWLVQRVAWGFWTNHRAKQSK